MTGHQVKIILKAQGVVFNKVAESMGETPQNFQSMLKVTDIKTGVLERIAIAIGKDISFFFEKTKVNNIDVFSSLNEIKNTISNIEKELRKNILF